MSKSDLVQKLEQEAEELFQELQARAKAAGIYRSYHAKGLRRLCTKWVKSLNADILDLWNINASLEQNRVAAFSSEDQKAAFLGIRFRVLAQSGGPYTRRQGKTSLYVKINTHTGEFEGRLIDRSRYFTNDDVQLRDLFNSLNIIANIKIKSKDELDEFIKTIIRSLDKSFDDIFQKERHKLGSKNDRKVLYDLSKSVLIQWAKNGIDTVYDRFVSHVDLELLNFIRASVESSKVERIKRSINLIDIYNHVLNAPEDGRAKEYRMGAVSALGSTSLFFLDDNEFWAKVDAGLPILDILSAKIEVTKGTLRNALKRPYLLQSCGNQDQLIALLKDLDQSDPQSWPQDAKDISYFQMCAQLAREAEKSFFIKTKDYMSELARGLGKSDDKSWRSVLLLKLVHEIASIRSDPSKLKNLSGSIHDWSNIIRQAVDTRLRSMRSIKDMHSDVERKIVLPEFIKMFEPRGFKISRTDSISHLIQKISSVIWGHASPSEHIENSAYWHSPRVRINERFQSAALAGGSYEEWKSFSSAPIELKCGARLIPLLSDVALKAEGSSMGHCVGGYAHKCIKLNYHIFHVELENGNSLSTLTVQDFFENGQRKVKLIENSGWKNERPSKLANDAADELIQSINDGSFKPDWHEIDQSKLAFQARDVEISVGYDFRDTDKCQAVFDVLKPCLPRKLTGSNVRTLDDFMARLRDERGYTIAALVDEFLADPHNLEIGGVVRNVTEQSLQPAPIVGVERRLG